MSKLINNNTININNLFKLFNKSYKNKEINNYKIEKSNNNIRIFNNKESILLYHLDDYVNIYQNVDNSINIIFNNIGSHGICENNEDIEFWLNLKKCIIIYSNDLKCQSEFFKSKENSFIIFVDENKIYN